MSENEHVERRALALLTSRWGDMDEDAARHALEQTEHRGDCTKDAFTCMVCYANEAREIAAEEYCRDREAGYLTVKWPPDYDAIWANIQKNAPETAKRRLSIHDFRQVIARVVAAIAAGAVGEE